MKKIRELIRISYIRNGIKYGLIWGLISPIAYLILGLFAIGGPHADTIAPILTYLTFAPLFIYNQFFYDFIGPLPGILDVLRVLFIQLGGWIGIFSLIFIITDEIKRRV